MLGLIGLQLFYKHHLVLQFCSFLSFAIFVFAVVTISKENSLFLWFCCNALHKLPHFAFRSLVVIFTTSVDIDNPMSVWKK